MLRRAILVPLLVLTLISCSLKKSDVQRILASADLNKSETLVIALPNKPTTLDWNLSSDSVSKIIEMNIMEGLTGFEIRGQNITLVPVLAMGWESTDDGKKYTFKIREGLKWSDGQILKAEDFLNSFKRVLTKKLQSPWAPMLYNIKNAKAFYEGEIQDFSKVGISAPDLTTLVFVLDNPVGYFPAVFTHHSTFPVRQDLIDKLKVHWTVPGNLVTLGAYQVGETQENKSISLYKNPHYPIPAKIKNVLCLLDIKSDEAVKLFDNKQVDAVIDIDPSELKKMKNKLELLRTPVLDISYMGFELKQKPLTNPIFRRIIGMAVDRDEVVKISGSFKITGGFIPPGLLGFESNRGVRFDPDAAKDLAKKSGWDMEKLGPFNIKIFNGEGREVATNIKEQLKKNLGLETYIVDIKPGVTLAPKEEKTPSLFVSHWLASIPDPDSFMSVFTSKSRNNLTGWKNRIYDGLVQKAAIADQTEAREKLYARAQHILTEEELPLISLYVRTNYVLVQKNVRDFPVNIMNMLPFQGIHFQ